MSIASNIAEGHERGGKEFARFLRVALGSAAELRTQAYIAAKVGLLSAEQMNTVVQELKTIAKMLTALRRSIQSKPNQTNPIQTNPNRKPKTEN